MTLLPLIEGSHEYFRRVIAQSGAPVFTRSPEEAIACTDEVMELLCCKTLEDLLNNDLEALLMAMLFMDAELMEVLGCVTMDDLYEVETEQLLQASKGLGLRVWAERDGNYLPADPYEAYAGGAAKDLDILQGCNKDELGYFICGFGLESYTAWAADRREKKLKQLTEEEKALVESFCRDAKDVTPEYTATDRLFDQIVFIAPLFRMSENQTMGGGRSYTYFFTPESDIPLMRCGHGVELAVVFDHQGAPGGRAFDETFSKTLRKMWVQFAKTGDPSLSADISPDGRAKEWPLYDLKDKYVMVFDEFNIHPEKESERKILDWERTYFLTKYYCI